MPSVGDIETRSLLSMQELDPSPVADDPPDIETGDYFPEPVDSNTGRRDEARSFGISRVGLKSHSWDYWRMFPFFFFLGSLYLLGFLTT